MALGDNRKFKNSLSLIQTNYEYNPTIEKIRLLRDYYGLETDNLEMAIEIIKIKQGIMHFPDKFIIDEDYYEKNIRQYIV